MAAHDPVALAEIELYGELIIAAAATPFDRLSPDRIDQVLRVASKRSGDHAEDEVDRHPPRVPAQRGRSDPGSPGT